MTTRFDELIAVVEQQGLNAKQFMAIMDAVEDAQGEYAYPVYMTEEQAKELMHYRHISFENFGTVAQLALFSDFESEELLHAWAHPELIEEEE